jgi:hypothetical protein
MTPLSSCRQEENSAQRRSSLSLRERSGPMTAEVEPLARKEDLVLGLRFGRPVPSTSSNVRSTSTGESVTLISKSKSRAMSSRSSIACNSWSRPALRPACSQRAHRLAFVRHRGELGMRRGEPTYPSIASSRNALDVPFKNYLPPRGRCSSSRCRTLWRSSGVAR